MGRKRKKEKRIMSDDGWMLWCNDCQGYQPESNFHNDKNRPFGKYYICKEHRKQKMQPKDDTDMSYLKYVFLSDDEKQEALNALERIGYDITKPIHTQFEQRIKNKYGVILG